MVAGSASIGQALQRINAQNARFYSNMRAAKSHISRFNPSDAIALITGHRKPRAPMERELALFGFITWMLFPNRMGLVHSAQVVGAANYYLSVSPAQRTNLARNNPHFSQETFAKTLLTFPLGDTFKLQFDSAYNETANIFEIIEFFMICPGEQRPSLLKALHFIEQGGFVADDVAGSEKHHYKRSAATLKKTWVNQAVAGPFIWAATALEIDRLMGLSPDQTKAIVEAKKFLARRRVILNFFGLARFCQERLISRLDERSRSRFRFVKFPPNVLPLECEFPDLDAVQMAVLKNYRAPKLID